MQQRLAKRVVLVGWAGADWRMIDPLLETGRLPHLERLIDSGVMGRLTTVQPQCESLLWTSLATGKRGHKHRILNRVEPAADGETVVPTSSGSRGCRAIWNMLAERGVRPVVVGWPTTHPTEMIDGVVVSDLFAHAVALPDKSWPLASGSVWPESLAENLAELRIHPSEFSGAELLPFVPRAAEVDQGRDPRLAMVATLLAECASVHAAATWLIKEEPWQFVAVAYDAIERFGHRFMRYHPPRLPQVSVDDFEWYQSVMTGIYEFSDMMLGRLLALAGEETTVILVSDHGFHSDNLRPSDGAAAVSRANWHREQGILVMRGEGVRRDEWLWGASLLDITPTVLTLFGLPVGEDMDGEPLVQAFEDDVDAQRIATWEAEEGANDDWPGRRLPDTQQARAMLDRLVQLGQIDPENIDDPPAAKSDRDYSLALVFMEADRAADALRLLKDLNERFPHEWRFALHLARCHHVLGNLADARRKFEEVIQTGYAVPRSHQFLGTLALAEGKSDAALVHFFQAEQANPTVPDVHCQIGKAYLQMQRWHDAEMAFSRAVELDDDCGPAWRGLAKALLELERFREAADAALSAVSLDFQQPVVHLYLGLALARIGKAQEAIQALETCLSQMPEFAEAHRLLSEIHRQVTHDDEKAAEHRRRAEALD